MSLQNQQVGCKKEEIRVNTKVVVFYVNVSGLTRNQQLLVCSAGVLISSLLYGYFLELLMVNFKMGEHSWIITCIQFSGYSAFAIAEAVLLKKDIGRKMPFKLLVALGFSTVIAIGFSNNALKYLNYPTHVIFKSCKLIPVMIGGVIIMKTKYVFLDLIACLLMSVGLSAFTLTGSHLSPNFHYIGVVIMLIALTADAVIGNLQERAMKVHEATSAEIMSMSFACGSGMILCYLTLTGEVWDSVDEVLTRPEVWLPTLGLVITGYLSVDNVLVLVKEFDALIAVTVTNLRKVFSLVLSFLMFTKPFSIHYIWSGVLVAIGVYLNVFSKRLERQQKPVAPNKELEEGNMLS